MCVAPKRPQRSLLSPTVSSPRILCRRFHRLTYLSTSFTCLTREPLHLGAGKTLYYFGRADKTERRNRAPTDRRNDDAARRRLGDGGGGVRGELRGDQRQPRV